jgi:hypothetical protein
MKRFLLLLFFITFFCSCNIDTKDKFVGKWIFKMYFENRAQVYFSSDDQIYMAADNIHLFGKYKIDNNSKTIWLYVDNKPGILAYNFINDSNLTLMLPNDTEITFEKVID